MKLPPLCINALVVAILTVGGCQSARPTCDDSRLISEQKARAIADAYLAYLQAQSDEYYYAQWGTPSQVSFQPEYSRYLFIYPTPERELQLVGNRGIFVDAKSRRAYKLPQL